MRPLRLATLAIVILQSAIVNGSAQPSPTPATVPVTANKSTGAIAGPVAAATFVSANGLVTTTGTQTLTNKTLTAPALGAATATSVAATGNLTTSAGYIGAGTASPLSLLHISSALGVESALTIGQVDVNRWKFFMAPSSPDLRIGDTGGTYVTVQAIGFGEVGIGTTAPVAPLHIGPNANTISSNDPAVLVSRDISDATGTGASTSAHGFVDLAAISRTGAGTGYAAFDARTQYSGTSGYDHWVGLQSLPVFGSSGTLTNSYGVYHALVVNSGAVTNSYGIWAGNASGAGAVTNQYGVYVASQTKGSSANYAVYTAGTAASYFGGIVEAGGVTGFSIGPATGKYRIDTAGGNFRFFTSSDTDARVTAGSFGGPEISDPAAPSANNGVLYFRDNGSGKTQLVVRFPTGAVQVVATEP
jgi:hypothetical protein